MRMHFEHELVSLVWRAPSGMAPNQAGARVAAPLARPAEGDLRVVLVATTQVLESRG